ncbi:hypothetical protein EHF33_05505 [Deinococcus psychrotolerans]|uniref:Uncharacterized protein n=1 Tax=Deinococcus psychrotolerans TaxID=2489213 RepID=A0A3G8YBH8_9DEIO|nr:hypothetical protein [Deinococcus psychrotolerans]AZI42273.1 hypothetical protein EHF33_05505 [Deinococcus psychrotolerans]
MLQESQSVTLIVRIWPESRLKSWRAQVEWPPIMGSSDKGKRLFLRPEDLLDFLRQADAEPEQGNLS